MNGKGSRRRPAAVPDEQVAANWGQTFAPRCDNCGTPLVLMRSEQADGWSETWHCPGEPHRKTPYGLVPGRANDPEQRRAVRRGLR